MFHSVSALLLWLISNKSALGNAYCLLSTLVYSFRSSKPSVLIWYFRGNSAVDSTYAEWIRRREASSDFGSRESDCKPQKQLPVSHANIAGSCVTIYACLLMQRNYRAKWRGAAHRSSDIPERSRRSEFHDLFDKYVSRWTAPVISTLVIRRE